MKRVVIVFSDHTQLWWLKGLKRGFRHCFMLLEQGNSWVLLDPRLDRLDIQIIPAMDHPELVAWYRRQNLIVVSAYLPFDNTHPAKPGPLVGPNSCVAVIKKILGIDKITLQTPWQLHKFLTHNKEQNMNKVLSPSLSTASPFKTFTFFPNLKGD